MDIQTAREILDQVDNVTVDFHRNVRLNTRTEVYVFSDYWYTMPMLDGDPEIDLRGRANYVTMRDTFIDYGWPFVIQSDRFAVPTDAPDEAIIELAESLGALLNHPVLDDEAYLNVKAEAEEKGLI